MPTNSPHEWLCARRPYGWDAITTAPCCLSVMLGAQAGQSAGEEVELELGGGDWQIGFDFVDTASGPQWHIWLDGEVATRQMHRSASRRQIGRLVNCSMRLETKSRIPRRRLV